MVKMTETAPRMQDDLQPTSEMPSQFPLSDSSSDFSLVSHPSESNIVMNGSFSAIHDLQFGLNHASVDLSFEEMQLSIQKLLQENAELKDVVQQDHVTMKSQYEIMLNSKQQIESFMKQQLQRREQAKAVIEKLQAENAQYREDLESNGDLTTKNNQTEQLNNELQEMKGAHDAISQEHEQQAILYHQLQMELAELRTDCSQLKSSHSHLLIEKRELAAMNAELQAKLAAVQQSPDEFVATSDGSGEGGDQQSFLVVKPNSSSANEGCSKGVKVEEQTIKGLLAQLSIEQTQSQALSAELIAEKAKVGEMAKQVEGQEEVIRRLVLGNQQQDAQEQGAHLMAELEASEHKINIANGYLEKYRNRCDSLENMLNVYQNKLETLQKKDANAVGELTAEIQCLRQALEAEQAQSADDKKNLQEALEKLELLMRDNDQVKQQWESFSQEQLSKGRQSEAYYSLQMKTLQEKIDSLTAKLVNYKEALAAKSIELATIKEENQNLKMEAETIPVLQAQVEVYKADFRAEHESRESLQEEKEQLLEELRAIQVGLSPSSRHSDHSHRFSHSSSRRHGRHADTPEAEINAVSPVTQNRSAPQLHNFGLAQAMMQLATAPTPEETQYVCPKCHFKFDSYHPLLNHVNECLDREDPFE